MAKTRSKSKTSSSAAYGADSSDQEYDKDEQEEVEGDVDPDKDKDESTDSDEDVLLGYEPRLLPLKGTATLKNTKCQLLFNVNKEHWNDFKWSFRAFLRNSSDGVYLPTQLIDDPIDKVLQDIEKSTLPYLETVTAKEQKKIKSR